MEQRIVEMSEDTGAKPGEVRRFRHEGSTSTGDPTHRALIAQPVSVRELGALGRRQRREATDPGPIG